MLLVYGSAFRGLHGGYCQNMQTVDLLFSLLYFEKSQDKVINCSMNVHQQTVRQPGGKISATGTDWNSNPTDSWVQGAEWGGFNIKGPIPKPMLYPSAGSGKCQACWRQLECTLAVTKAESAASHLIDGFINEGYLTEEKVGFITSLAAALRPAITSLCLRCFNSIMIQRQDKWVDWLTWDRYRRNESCLFSSDATIGELLGPYRCLK